jgi:hypothetical protein
MLSTKYRNTQDSPNTNLLHSNKLTTLKIGNLQPDEDNRHRQNRLNIHSRTL